MRKYWFLLMIVAGITVSFSQEKTLAESLGYPVGARVLIVNADDFGMCHAENVGTEKVLEYGVVSSSTVMMPCPWALEALAYSRENRLSNIGVHLTLTSEWKYYRWRPMNRFAAGKSSLVDAQGYFWSSAPEVELYADIAEVKAEIRAQIQSAVDSGVQISHFDSHMGSLYGLYTGRKDLLAGSLAFSYEFGLPFRLPYQKELKPFRDMGFAILDHLVLGYAAPSDPAERKKYFIQLLKDLSPGVTEIYIHPAVYNEESARITHSAKVRQAEVDIFTDPEVRDVIIFHGIYLVSYEPLRKWQRDQMHWKPGLSAEDVYPEYLRILQQNPPESARTIFLPADKNGE